MGKYGRRFQSSKYTDNGDWALGLNDGKPYFTVHYTNTNTIEATTGSAITTDVWHHIAGVKDALNQIRLYINGQEQTPVAATTSYSFNSLYPLEI